MRFHDHRFAADTYAPNGVYADSVYKNLKGLKYRLSYQPAWDQHARMLEQLAASVPMAMVPGSECCVTEYDCTFRECPVLLLLTHHFCVVSVVMAESLILGA
jgi:hypothetical protein